MSTLDRAVTDDDMAHYALNAAEAGKVMLAGTKGHMLATEAVPRLIDEVKKLRSIVSIVCSHPRSFDGQCLYCGVPDDDAETYRAAGDAIKDGDTERLANIVNRDVEERARKAAPDA